ncbi:MAG: FAD-dependent oxidoreductase [Pararhodobacter sp.]|nr:FAD-dependent oxidoreductase [Pararhodobacter sp.]
MAQETAEIVIIGAGMAGIACARQLAAAGRAPVLLDKGRGIGGRMATRRVPLAGVEVSFDHGAQYVTVRDPGFAKAIATAPGSSADWADGAAEPHLVGIPGMSGLPRALADGLDIRLQTEVISLSRMPDGWQVQTSTGTLNAGLVVLTIPAPQAAHLLAKADLPGLAVGKALTSVQMDPCLTLMAAFPADAPRPFVNRSDTDDPLAWIAQDSTKPGRTDRFVTWVAQASPGWSMRHLHEPADAIAARLLPRLCDRIGADAGTALHVSAHRWRYARVRTPLGRPFLHDARHALYLGGDWCQGARAEAAWQSGSAIARAVLGIETAA